MNREKFAQWATVLFSWWFMLSLLLVLRDQWLDDDMMTSNFGMVVIMLIITGIVFHCFALLTMWMWYAIGGSDKIRTMCSVWWKRGS